MQILLNWKGTTDNQVKHFFIGNHRPKSIHQFQTATLKTSSKRSVILSLNV